MNRIFVKRFILVAAVFSLLFTLTGVVSVAAEDMNGTCGDGVTWSITGSTLTIDGTGDMYVYEEVFEIPWFYENYRIDSINIGAGVTGLAPNVFQYSDNVTKFTVHENNNNYKSVDGVLFDESGATLVRYPSAKEDTSYTVPANVTSIADFAFYQVINLVDVELPSELESMGTSAFAYCSDLSGVDIPHKITSVAQEAFYYCESLEYVSFSSGTTRIGNNAFYGCKKLTEIDLPATVKTIGDSAFSSCSLLKTVSMQNGIESIGKDAFFYCYNLTDISIPDSVTYIGTSAFASCGAVTKINLPAGLKDIAANTFEGCSSLSEITIPSGVSSIGRAAFYNCTKLADVTINNGVAAIGESAFFNCDGLKEIRIPDSVVEIQDSVFSSCNNLASVYIGSGLNQIGKYVFNYCPNLNSVVVDSKNASLCTVNNVLFDKSKTKLIMYLPTLTDTQYTVPNGVVEIAVYAFGNCKNLETISLPHTLRVIGESAFSGCENLTSMYIPSNVEKLGTHVFSSCSSMAEINIASGNKAYCSVDGNIFNKQMTKMIYYAPANSRSNYSIPNGVVEIAANAFAYAKKLTSVTLPQGVKTIDNNAFSYCSSLSEVTIPNSVVALGAMAFQGCKLNNIYYGGSEENWKTITSVNNNYYLSNVTVHYSEHIDIAPQLVMFEDNDTVVVGWLNVDDIQGRRLILASYDENGDLIDLKMNQFYGMMVNNNVSFYEVKNEGYLKAFFWDGVRPVAVTAASSN